MILARKPVVVGVSDVSLGYGSPQMPALLESLAEHYAPCRAVVIEPDQSERPPRPERFPTLEFERLPTRFAPYTREGLVEYNAQAARLVAALQPDLLVVSSTLVLPALLRLRRRPKFTIYYMLESLAYYAQGDTPHARFMLNLNRHAARQLDLVIYPETNRATADLQRGGLSDVPLVICYNAVNHLAELPSVTPVADRLPRILYSGTIHRQLTLGEYFLHPDVAKLPLDLYGLVEGEGKHGFEAELCQLPGPLRYRGYVDAGALAKLRKQYAFSLVAWAPIDEHTLYACPNKFFEAIADGVPPIVTPHPQCKQLVERYDCGIVMRDWGRGAFQNALQQGLRALGTSRYADWVANCRRAVEAELSWDDQFRKVAAHLPESLA